MNVSLQPDMEALIKEKVDSGMYNSAGEVVREALLLLKAHDELNRIRLAELRREIAVGIEQADRGETADLDIEAIKAEGRRRMAEKQRHS